jgi:hypothetical protein
MERASKYSFAVVIFIIALAAASWGSVIFTPPDGGWTYKFEGDQWGDDPMFALDGFWSHENGSDAWDGTTIGDGMPGGLSDYTEIMDGDTTTFIRIQDPGDPRAYGFSDPSNRKIYLGYDISTNDAPAGDSTLLDDGITISFRSRVSVPGGDFELDDWHPADGFGPDEWKQTGDGYVVHDGGKGNFSVHQLAGGTISFCLAVQTDHAYLDSVLMKEGLVMNRKGANVNWQGAANDTTFDPESVCLVELDPRVWHEFWITIQAAEDTTGGATHKVDVYMDGSTEAQTFHTTAGTGSDFSASYIAMGCGATPQEGAYDVDFYAYKPGIHLPTGGNAVTSDGATPGSYELSQNYPNPFNPTTTINYSLAKAGYVTLTVYDVLGREVQRVVDEMKNSGEYSVALDGAALESGIYFYKLQVGSEYSSLKKMILMK